MKYFMVLFFFLLTISNVTSDIWENVTSDIIDIFTQFYSQFKYKKTDNSLTNHYFICNLRITGDDKKYIKKNFTFNSS